MDNESQILAAEYSRPFDAVGDNRPSKNPYWEGTGDLRLTP